MVRGGIGLTVRKRDLRLGEYGISKTKYNELKYFCLQYAEKKQEIANSYSLGAMNYDGMPKGSGTGQPTENRAVRNAMLSKDIELIEQTAIEADSELYESVLKSVTEGVAYEYMDIPQGRRQFYEARRYFFYLLAQKR